MVKSQVGWLAVLPLRKNTEGVTTPGQSAVVRAERQNWVVYSGLVFTMFVWGLAWPVGRLLATNLPPVSIAAIRYAVVIPVLIAIMASFVLKERLTWTKILGFASGLAGIITISILSPNTQVLNRPLGVTLVFGGAAAYALYTVLLRGFLSKNRADNNGPQQSSLSILSWISLFGWFFLIPFSLLEAPWTYTWDAGSWLGIVYLAILSTIVGYFLYIEGVSKIGAGRSGVFTNLVPVFGVLTSVLIGEKLSPWTAVSFLLILAGVLLVNRQVRSSGS